MKKNKAIRFISVLFMIFLILFSAFYVYWGRNHKVLYNISSIEISDQVYEQGCYDVTIQASAKNWPGDFKTKKFTFVLAPRGSIDYSGIECESDCVVVNSRKTSFNINLKIYPEHLNKETLKAVNRTDIEKFVKELWFDDTTDGGPQYTLYMQDFEHVTINWKN